MGSANRQRDELLTEWAERCAAEAGRHAGRTLPWRLDGGIVRYPCPHGGDHAYKGDDPQAWAIVDTEGHVKAGCRKCAPKGSDLEAGYTASTAALIGIDPEEQARRGAGVEVLRSHDYETHDGRFVIRHSKFKRKHGNAQPYWGFSWRPVAERGVFSHWRPCGKGDLKAFKAEHYPSLIHTYHMVQLYQHERFRQPDGSLRDVYRVAVLEGEKDAETFNALMRAVDAGIIGTALPHQAPTSLASHQEEIIADKPVILIPDPDEGGARFAGHWSAAAWERASSVKVFPVENLAGQDFTEWVETERGKGRTDRVIAQDVIQVLTSTAALAEPLMHPTGWRNKLRETQKGGVSSTNLYNGKVVWTEHPELTGKVRFNTMTGEVEVVDPPWPGDVTVGAGKAGTECSVWLDEAHGVALSARVLSEAAGLSGVAAPYSPHAEMLAEPWDGVARLDGLLTHYIPLKLAQAEAVNLAKVLVGDMVAKLRGDLTPQRVLLVVNSPLQADVARALAGPRGILHHGRIGDMAALTRREAAIVQLDAEAVAHRTSAPHNTPLVFGSYVWNPRSEVKLPSPWFLAVGRVPRKLWEVHEQVIMLELHEAMRLDDLTSDASQILAEGLVRIDELLAAAPGDRDTLGTIDEARHKEAHTTMVRALVLYATRDIALNQPVDMISLPSRDRLQEPRRHVIREQFFHVMRPVLMDEWRRESEWVTAFWSTCRAFCLPTRVGLTENICRKLGWLEQCKPDGKLTAIGTYLHPEKLAALRSWLQEVEEPEFTPVYDSVSPAASNGLRSLRLTGSSKKNDFDSTESKSLSRARIPVSLKREENVTRKFFAEEIDGAWKIKIDGEPVDPAALAEQLVADNLLGDALVLRSPTPVELMRWLDEVGLLDAVEVEAIDPAGEVGEDGRKPGR